MKKLRSKQKSSVLVRTSLRTQEAKKNINTYQSTPNKWEHIQKDFKVDYGNLGRMSKILGLTARQVGQMLIETKHRIKTKDGIEETHKAFATGLARRKNTKINGKEIQVTEWNLNDTIAILRKHIAKHHPEITVKPSRNQRKQIRAEKAAQSPKPHRITHKGLEKVSSVTGMKVSAVSQWLVEHGYSNKINGKIARPNDLAISKGLYNPELWNGYWNYEKIILLIKQDKKKTSKENFDEQAVPF